MIHRKKRGESAAGLDGVRKMHEKLRLGILMIVVGISLWKPTHVHAQAQTKSKSKSGVAPQVLSLPQGGGAVKGLGETFVPDLNSGTGSYAVPLSVPPGRAGMQPTLALTYSSGRGSSPFGLGWDIGLSAIQRRTDKGVPTYRDDDDIFTYGGTELIKVAEGQYRPKYEGLFAKIFHRKGDGRDSWEVWFQSGERHLFGETDDSRVRDGPKVFAWHVTRQIDANGNEIRYAYDRFGSTNLYLARIEYAIYEVVFSYEDRFDRYISYRSGFAVATERRCSEILIKLQDDVAAAVSGGRSRIRKYRLSYSESPGSRLSLLTQITQHGTDDAALLPPLDLKYSEFDPSGAFRQMRSLTNTPPARGLGDPNFELADIDADSLTDVLSTGPEGHLYWLNMGDDTWAAPQPIRRTPQGVELADDGVMLADMNGDGKSDLLLSRGVSLGYWTSYGRERWEDFVAYRGAPNVSFKDPNVLLWDVNGDGLTDVVHTDARYYTYWLNREGQNWWRPVSRPFSSIFRGGEEGPGTFHNAANRDSDFRLADMNGDGLQDIVSVHNRLIRYWPHKGYLRFEPAVRMRSDTSEGPGRPDLPLSRFDRSRFFLADLNGDGFDDAVYVDLLRVHYWLNLHGEFWSARQEIKYAPYADGATSVRFADMNGNGTRDLVWSHDYRGDRRPNYRYFDFVGNNRYPNLLVAIDNNMGLTTQISYQPVVKFYLQARRERRPCDCRLPIPVKVVSEVRVTDRISRNEIVHHYAYRDGYYDGREREFRGFGYAETGVTGDETSPTMLTKSYFNVGYGERIPAVTAAKNRSMQGRLMRTEVYGLDGSPDQGKPYQVVRNIWESAVLAELEQRSPGGRARREFLTFPRLKATITSAYERTDTPKHTAVVYEQYDDEHGGIRRATQFGEVAIHDTEDGGIDIEPRDVQRVTETEYAVRDDGAGYVVKPWRALVSDGAGEILGEQKNYYDGEAFVGLPERLIERGRLHRVSQRVLTPQIIERAYGDVIWRGVADVTLDQWVDTERYQYNEAGLLLTFKDAKEQRAVRVEQYDRYGLFPLRVTNALGHAQTVEHDYLAGQISRYRDPNGAETTYFYDALGLVERVVRPGDSYGYPTLWYRYDLLAYWRDAAARRPNPLPPHVTTWARERPPASTTSDGRPAGGAAARRADPEPLTAEADTYVSRMFFDGLGRTIQTRAEDRDGRVLVSGWTEYNQKGKAKAQYLPFFSTGFDYVAGEKPPDATEREIAIRFFYDALERLRRTINPNGTFQKVELQPWQSAAFDEEDVSEDSPHYDTPKISRLDAWGRLVEVTEFARRGEPIVTRYGYDLNDNLAEIVDAQGNRRWIVYDLLGRQLRSFEPNTGTRVYSYDVKGNLIYRRDNKRQWVRYEYDALDRLARKSYFFADRSAWQLVVTNTYDTGPGSNLVGRLAHVRDESGETEHGYDARGRLVRKTRRLDGLDRAYTIGYSHDSMDRVVQIAYPQVRDTSIAYEYDEGGRLRAIPGYVTEIRYNPKGQRETIVLANGVRTSYGYDPQTFWLNALRTIGTGARVLQDMTYTHDGVGNILTIHDSGPSSGTQTYGYDALYRLLTATSRGTPTYSHGYAYDVVGNIIEKSDLSLERIAYGLDSRPHTMDRYVSLGGHAVELGYDENGNLSREPGVRFYQDYEDRLIRVETDEGLMSEYTYDANGERARKTVTTAASSVAAVYYVDGTLEIRDRKEIVCVFDGSNRIARIEEGAQVVYYHADHLGSTRFLSSDGGLQFGRQFVYDAYGRNLSEAATGVSAEYKYNGKEFDEEVGLYYYGARYYAPSLARWTSKDPIEPPSGTSPYAYARNSPVVWVDRLGLQESQVQPQGGPILLDFDWSREPGVVFLVRQAVRFAATPRDIIGQRLTGTYHLWSGTAPTVAPPDWVLQQTPQFRTAQARHAAAELVHGPSLPKEVFQNIWDPPSRQIAARAALSGTPVAIHGSPLPHTVQVRVERPTVAGFGMAGGGLMVASGFTTALQASKLRNPWLATAGAVTGTAEITGGLLYGAGAVGIGSGVAEAMTLMSAGAIVAEVAGPLGVLAVAVGAQIQVNEAIARAESRLKGKRPEPDLSVRGQMRGATGRGTPR